MCTWFHTRGTWLVGFFPRVLEVFLCHRVSYMQDFVPYNNNHMIPKKKKEKVQKTASSFNGIANKKPILLTPGNIQTPKSLWC